MCKKSMFLILVASVLFVSCTPRQEEPLPETPVQETCFYHTVKYSGETLASISAWYTGSASNWTTILAANEGMDERKIMLGTNICIPSSLVKKETPLPKPVVRAPQITATESANVDNTVLEEQTKIESKEKNTDSIEDEVRKTLMQGSPVEQLAPTPAVVRRPRKPVHQDEEELRKTRERLLREMLLDE